MSKIALYRKYRPQNFSQVIAQDFVVKTLKQEVINDSIHHAYIFSGTRGSGKTSVARIFAHAVNCLQPMDGDCCGQCANCLSNLSANTIDIHEIDAASNSGVDEVRKLIETVHYLPTQLKKKVYIIDEAHMLSNSAWNALLKTIEEPPTHVMFIFATTEVNKIPMTIMSRCQRFDFYQLSLQHLIDLISDVCNKEAILISNEAKIKIAQLSDGSARDCLSILHQINNYSNGEITIAYINEVFGLLSLEFKINFINNAFNANKISNLLQEIEVNTSNYLGLAKDLIDIVIDKIIYEKTQDLNLLKFISLSDAQKITLPVNKLQMLLDICVQLYEKIKLFNNGLFYFKNTLLKIAQDNDVEPMHSTTNNVVNITEPKTQPKDILSAFKTKTVTDQYVTNQQSNDKHDFQELFNQIVSNEQSEIKDKLSNNLEQLKTSGLNEELNCLLNCKKILVASQHGAILLFDFMNQAREFNELFWSKDGYSQIKAKWFDNQDYVLIAGDKQTIKTWRDKYLSSKKTYSDVSLQILQAIKPMTEDEKYKMILDLMSGDKE